MKLVEDLIKLIVDNGIGVACVMYMIYFQNTTMKEMLTTLNGINTRLAVIEEDIVLFHGPKEGA